MDESVTASPRTPVSCTIQVRGHVLLQDKPPASGGADDGPMASEFLLAAIAACQLSTMHKVRAKRGVDVDFESVTVGCTFDDKSDIDAIQIAWKVTKGDDKDVATIVKLTDRVCTISRALKVPVETSYSN